MIEVVSGFKFTNSTEPLDGRNNFPTIADMKACEICDEGHITFCKATGKTYRFVSKNIDGTSKTKDSTYGYWEEFEGNNSSITAKDVSYDSSETYSNGTVGKELQSLASDIGLKVSGIQVTGEDNIRYPINGIVTIPAGGGGTGTITGATVGGAPVTESGGILQFDAYPTVPITSIETSDHTPLAPDHGLVTLPAIPTAPTADTMQYSGSTNYSTGSIGKEVKDLNASITNLSTKVADLDKDKPSPTPSSSITTVNLASYATSGSSFTYDVDNKYIYNTKDTTFYQYSEEDNSNTVYYGVFKVIGEDRYLMYSITNNTTFTYVNTYTESTLPENAKKEFALGSVAVVKRVNGEGESWKNGTVNLFCTKQNMPLRNRCKNINFNGSTAWRVLIKSEDGNTIFVYKANSNDNYEWEINVPRSSTANFNLLDKYFDRSNASDIDFDNTNTGLNATNVNDAIDKTFTTLKHTLGSATVSNESFTLPSTVTGNTYYDITSTPITSLTIPSINSPYEVVIKFTTHSTDTCTVTIPNNQKYIGDFSVDKGVTYIMSIFNGVIIIAETETYTNS